MEIVYCSVGFGESLLCENTLGDLASINCLESRLLLSLVPKYTQLGESGELEGAGLWIEPLLVKLQSCDLEQKKFFFELHLLYL